MGLKVNPPPFKMSVYTTEDSDGNDMLSAHAYRAVNAGVVEVYGDLRALNANLRGYVGSTDDPVGAGLLIHYRSHSQAFTNDLYVGFSLHLAKNEYFEITCTITPVIHWKSFGPLQKPIDFN